MGAGQIPVLHAMAAGQAPCNCMLWQVRPLFAPPVTACYGGVMCMQHIACSCRLHDLHYSIDLDRAVSRSTWALTSLSPLHILCSTTALAATSTCALCIQPLPQLTVGTLQSPYPPYPSSGLTPSISFFILRPGITLTPFIRDLLMT